MRKSSEVWTEVSRWAHLDKKDGVVAIEYAMLGTFIALVVVVAVTALGTQLNTAIANLSGAF